MIGFHLKTARMLFPSILSPGRLGVHIVVFMASRNVLCPRWMKLNNGFPRGRKNRGVAFGTDNGKIGIVVGRRSAPVVSSQTDLKTENSNDD
jgi:hypothetical protein